MVSSKEIKEKIGFYYRILQKGEESMAIKNKILIISLFLLLIGKCFGEDIEITKIKKLKLVTEWRIEGEDGITDFEIDSKGNIYLAVKNRIKVYSFSGKFLKEIGKEGDKENYYEKEIIKGVYEYIEKGGERGGEFLALTDIAIDSNDNIYAADMALNKILKFDSSGHFIKKWGKSGIGDGEFFPLLLGIAGIDFHKNIYAYDTTKIHKFDSEGKHLSTIKIEGFKTFLGLKVDSYGNIILLHCGDKKLLVYDQNGVLQKEMELPVEEIIEKVKKKDLKSLKNAEKKFGKISIEDFIPSSCLDSNKAVTIIFPVINIILGFWIFEKEIQIFVFQQKLDKFCFFIRKHGNYFYIISIQEDFKTENFLKEGREIFMHIYKF